jgi:hypothetical protein
VAEGNQAWRRSLKHGAHGIKNEEWWDGMLTLSRCLAPPSAATARRRSEERRRKNRAIGAKIMARNEERSEAKGRKEAWKGKIMTKRRTGKS